MVLGSVSQNLSRLFRSVVLRINAKHLASGLCKKQMVFVVPNYSVSHIEELRQMFP